jgi:hypothetical protein
VSGAGGAGRVYTPASGWCVCTGSGGAPAVALALRMLAPGGIGLAAAGSGLVASWEALTQRDHDLEIEKCLTAPLRLQVFVQLLVRVC